MNFVDFLNITSNRLIDIRLFVDLLVMIHKCEHQYEKKSL